MDFKSVFDIVIVSCIIGLFANYLNPEAIPLIKKERKLVWDSDSSIAKSNSENYESTLTIKPNTESREPVAITLKQAYKLYNEKVLFLDARDLPEFEISHIKGAVSLSYYDFDKYKSLLDTIPLTTPLVAYCDGKDCDLSIMLSDKLYEKGYGKVYIFYGGWVDWQSANYPVESGYDQN
jgi:rhodanese-related sulfurtransferase